MTANDFSAEEEEILNGGRGATLQEFRRLLLRYIKFVEDELMVELLVSVFNKIKLMTEREWDEISKCMPLPGMRISEEDKNFDFYADDDYPK